MGCAHEIHPREPFKWLGEKARKENNPIAKSKDLISG